MTVIPTTTPRRRRADRPAVTIDQALADPQLLGAALGSLKSWSAWIAVLRAAFGLRLGRQDRQAFDRVAGGRNPPPARVGELWAVAGRRSGKSRMAAAIAVYLAVFIDHRATLSPGEIGYVLVLAPTQKQARLVFQYALAFLQASPILKTRIEGVTTDEIRLQGGIIIATHPNSFRSVRGRTLLACVFDESAFWRDDTTATPDVETYRAVLPALGASQGPLIGISSPYRKTGLLFTKYRDHFGKDDPNILVVQAPSLALNPTLKESVVAQARAEDAESAAAEWDAIFRSDLSALLDDKSIEDAIDHDRPLELPPAAHRYVAFCDASAGKHDAFTICIGHLDADRFVADSIRGRHPPFDPVEVAKDLALLARSYGCRKIHGDAFAGEWVARAFREADMDYVTSDLPKSALYLEGVPMFSRGLVSIPDLTQLTRELRLLERRTSRIGKDIVDHGSGGSDDYANVVFGAMRYAIRAVGVQRPLRDIVVQGMSGFDPFSGRHVG